MAVSSSMGLVNQTEALRAAVDYAEQHGTLRDYSNRAIPAAAIRPRYFNARAARSLLTSLESAMTRKHAPLQSALPEPGTSPVPPKTEPHHDVTSPTFDHANDRMKLAAEPNDGQPLSHRDRGKAGRKG